AYVGLQAARRTGDFEQAHENLLVRSLAAATCGDFAAFDRLDDERRADAQRMRRPLDALSVLALRARRHLLDGDFEAAEAAVLEEAELEERLGLPMTMARMSTAQMVWLRWWQGRAGELREMVRAVSDALPPEWVEVRLVEALTIDAA